MAADSPRLLRIEQSNPFAWALLPYILDRVALFCEKYDPETVPREMSDLVKAWFVVGDQRLGLWVAERQGVVCAHLLATPEPLGSEGRYILVRQAEVDPGVDIRDITRTTFAAVEEWTKSYGLSRICMVTHRNAHAMARMWGFKPYKTIMTKDLK